MLPADTILEWVSVKYSYTDWRHSSWFGFSTFTTDSYYYRERRQPPFYGIWPSDIIVNNINLLSLFFSVTSNRTFRLLSRFTLLRWSHIVNWTGVFWLITGPKQDVYLLNTRPSQESLLVIKHCRDVHKDFTRRYINYRRRDSLINLFISRKLFINWLWSQDHDSAVSGFFELYCCQCWWRICISYVIIYYN